MIDNSPGVTINNSAVLSNADNGVKIEDSRVIFSDTLFSGHQDANEYTLDATGTNTITANSSIFEG